MNAAPGRSRRRVRRARRGPALRALVALALLTGAAGCAGGDDGAPVRPRDLLLISIDTLRADRLGCYGNERPTSPGLDALAARGALFADVTAPCPWTLPSHVSLLTGLYPSRHGVKSREQALGPATRPLASVLGEAGWRTAAVVNAHYVSERYGIDRGFDEFTYVSEYEAGPDGRPRIVNRGAEVTERAVAWLRDRPRDEPFFLFLHYYDVHTDLDPAPEHREAFAGPPPPDPSGEPLTGSTGELAAVRFGQRELSEAEGAWLRDLYDAEIRTLDDRLAPLLALLEDERFADTLVVVTSDHGEEFLEHGSVLHGRTYYQEVVHVPLVLVGPGVPPGLRVPDPVSLVDVAPTVLGLLGAPPLAEADGRDLGALLRRGAPRAAPRFLFAEADHNNLVDGRLEGDVGRLVRQGDWKLVVDTRDDGLELFDLARDPAERVDRSAEEEERVRLFLERLAELRAARGEGRGVGEPTPEELRLLRSLGY